MTKSSVGVLQGRSLIIFVSAGLRLSNAQIESVIEFRLGSLLSTFSQSHQNSLQTLRLESDLPDLAVSALTICG